MIKNKEDIIFFGNAVFSILFKEIQQIIQFFAFDYIIGAPCIFLKFKKLFNNANNNIF